VTVLNAQQTFVYKAGVSFNATANVTLTAPDPRFNFRKHTTLLAAGVLTDVSVETQTTAGGTDTNGIVSVAYGGTVPPTLYMAFFNSSTNASPGSSPITLSVSESSGYVGLVFAKMDEVTSSGDVVVSFNLESQTWNYLTAALTTVDATRALAYTSFTADITGGTISITLAVSAVLGVINEGAIITPAAIESFFEVNGYTYASSTNSLRLTFYLVQASTSSGTVSSGQILTAGSGAAQCYMSVSNQAQINGSPKSVTVTGMSSATVSYTTVPNSNIVSQLASFTGLTVEAREIQVTFTAGATAISYDPSAGFGSPSISAQVSATPTPNAGFNNMPQFCLYILAVIFLVLAL